MTPNVLSKHQMNRRARDRPDKTFGIEVYNCFEYRRMRLHWNGCGLMLHELCHLIHQLALEDGLDNATVKRAYGLAKVTGLYDTVRRRDWAGRDQDFDLAYAMVDFKEFFAEMSVAYWCEGYPELDQRDRNRITECSPPFVEPNVLERIQNKNNYNINDGPTAACHQERKTEHSLFRMPCFLREQKRRSSSHCNKFYPFTRGQLKYHDPDTFRTMETLWRRIAEWEDPWDQEVVCGKAPGCFLPDFCKKNAPPQEIYADTVDL